MSIASKLGSMLSGNIFDGVSKIIGMFKVPPEQVEEHAFELQKLSIELEQKYLEAARAEVQAASDNIKAEASSGDRYTSRARPTFLYIVDAVLAFNFLFLPIYQLCMHQALSLIVLPRELYWLFGSCELGYVGASHWSDFMGLPGESKINLPFGMSMGNNSDGGKK